MDTTKYAEDKYITAELVKNSPTKTVVVVTEGDVSDGEFGEQFVIDVQLDRKNKKWRMNKDTLRNMHEAFGTDSAVWIGKKIKLQVVRNKGKDGVLGIPIVEENKVFNGGSEQ